MEKQVKICMYPSTATREQVLTTNGIILDNYCVKAQTIENINTGEYTLDCTFTTEVQDLLEEENILKVLMDYGYEVFKISKPFKSLRYIDVTARQITIAESLTLYLDDVRPTNQTGQGCLTWLMDHADGVKEITLFSDIDKICTAYYEDKSLYEALHDSSNSFTEVWGGEILRRGYTLTINKHIGTDRNVVIREGKNLQGFDGFTNIDTLVTKARGKGFNGLKGNWIDSKYINNYARVYRKTIEFSDVKVKTESDTEGFATESEAIAELDNRIRRQYEENEIDKLKATYNINFVQLEKTEEYKKYIHAERTYIGDTLGVYIPKIKVDIKVRAIAKRYDILAQKTIEITLSNVAEKQAISINTVIENLKEEYKKTGNNSLSSYIDSMMKAGLQGSYVLVRDNEFLALDTKDINTATKVVRINKNGLAFSSTGYYGEYTYGFTIDGKFNASLISTGILTAILIESKNKRMKIDLNSGEINIKDENGRVVFSVDGQGNAQLAGVFKQYDTNGNIAIDISENEISLYDWITSGFYLGGLAATDYQLRSGGRGKALHLFSSDGTPLFLGSYSNTENMRKYGIAIDTSMDINYGRNYTGVYTDMGIYSGGLYLYWEDPNGLIKYGHITADTDNDIAIEANGVGHYVTLTDGTNLLLSCGNGQVYMPRDCIVDGNFEVHGNKNCIQPTEHYGNRKFYSIEDAESYLTDRNLEELTVVKNLETNLFERTILLDPIFKESTNLDMGYDIAIHKTTYGDFKIKEKTKDYFILESDKEDFKFTYVITGKRKGFENKRLEIAYDSNYKNKTYEDKIPDTLYKNALRKANMTSRKSDIKNINISTLARR